MRAEQLVVGMLRVLRHLGISRCLNKAGDGDDRAVFVALLAAN